MRAAGVLDADAVRLLGIADGREDRGRALWTVLSLQCWAERWTMRPAPAVAPRPTATAVAAARN